MPAKSQAQRAYLNAKFGHAWVKAHHFDNKGVLPRKVGMNAPEPAAERKAIVGKDAMKYGKKKSKVKRGGGKMPKSHHVGRGPKGHTPVGAHAGDGVTHVRFGC